MSEDFQVPKQQYDALLQKSQHDLIAFRQKENSLNALLSSSQSEAKQLLQENNLLKQQLEAKNKLDLESNRDLTIQELQRNVRSLMDENIMLTSRNTELDGLLQLTRNNYQHQNGQLQSQYNLLWNQHKNLENKCSALQEQHRRLKEQYEALSEKYSILEDKNKPLTGEFSPYKQAQSDWCKTEVEMISQQSQASMQILNNSSQLNNDLRKFKAELQELKLAVALQQKPLKTNTQKNRQKTRKLKTHQQCEHCAGMQCEVKLLKDMIKSSNTIIRVKQMELDRFRKLDKLSTPNLSTKKRAQLLPPIRK